MKSKTSSFFWPSFTDLMTSLFFIMLVLFVLVFVRQQNQIKGLKRKLAIVDAVDENLRPLKNDTSFFKYEEEYKRYKLAFDIKFKIAEYSILQPGVKYLEPLDNTNPTLLRGKIINAGVKLQTIIKGLYKSKLTNIKLQNVSYILVIAGYASRDKTGEISNYELSYKRALSLWQFWKDNGIDFEDSKYNGLIDLQISGNGWGGIGRLPDKQERDNQRFLIQIFPKIGDIK